MSKTCKECKFSRVKYDTSNLMCCKNAPIPDGANIKAYWPFVNPGIPDYDWCGEFEARIQKEK